MEKDVAPLPEWLNTVEDGDEFEFEIDEAARPGGEFDPTLYVDEEHPGCVNIYFEEAPRHDLALGNVGSTPARRVLLCVADATRSALTLFPIGTLRHRGNYLKPKYSAIESITLSGLNFSLPNSGSAAAEMFLGLPAGFVKDYRFGLGLKKEYAAVIAAIEENQDIRHIVIDFRNEGVQLDAGFFTVSFDEFDSLRRAFDRTSSTYRRKALVDKRILAYNTLLSALDSTAFPFRTRTYEADTIYKIVSASSSSAVKLSSDDQATILNLAHKNKSELMQTKPKELLQLRDDIEVVALQELILLMAEMLKKRLTEAAWQSFFAANPFVLSMAFGYPIIIVGGQASIGGTKLTGGGGKITDFVVKNLSTDNAALVEIKTPSTKLLCATPYRGGVHAPSSDLAGAINQCLDQRFLFQKDIATTKSNSDSLVIETYGVKCVLIVGTTPDDKILRKSFELVRHSLKDVEVVTFDELLAKLRILSSVLAPSTPEADLSSEVSANGK